MDDYRIFDVAFTSELPLPGVLRAQGMPARFRVVKGQGAATAGGFEPVHEWPDRNGNVTMVCTRRGSVYRLDFPRIGLFELQPGRITVYPGVDTGAESIAHLLMDQVIPRYLCHQGRVVMHASSVLLPGGQGVAFFGDSGRGKSTLAASFSMAGFPVLADDCLELDRENGRMFGRAAYPSVRLWPDSVEALFGNQAGFQPVSRNSDKRQRFSVAEPGEAMDRFPLAALFVLNDPVANPSESIAIQPLAGVSAARALIEASFSLDLADRDAVRGNFQRVAAVAAVGVPVFSLAYPRRYEALENVRSTVLEAVSP